MCTPLLCVYVRMCARARVRCIMPTTYVQCHVCATKINAVHTEALYQGKCGFPDSCGESIVQSV